MNSYDISYFKFDAALFNLYNILSCTLIKTRQNSFVVDSKSDIFIFRYFLLNTCTIAISCISAH